MRRKIIIQITCLLIIVIVWASTTNCFSQNRNNCRQTYKKEALDAYNQAVNYLNVRSKDAYDLLLRAIQVDPKYVDAHYLLGDINLQKAVNTSQNIENKAEIVFFFDNAKKFFMTSIKLCPQFNNYLAYYYLADAFYRTQVYDKSKENLEIFLAQNKTDFQQIESAKKMLQNIEEYFKIINNPVYFDPKLVEGVNTSDDEFLPLISPDGELIFFTRRRKQNKNSKDDNQYIEELMFGKRKNPIDSLIDIYGSTRLMPLPFNDGRNQGGATITIDNKHIFITICEYERANYTSYVNCDIFTSDHVDGKWTALKRLGTNVNGSGTFEGQPSITADGKELYFASAREGGYGGIDIYRSVKEENGEWGKAENLGPFINSQGDDKTPFIHTDSHTLYFSSNGRIGVGGFDIFYSQFKNGQWTVPKNIGYPINTSNDEVGLIVSASGKKIYFSSNSLKGKGGWDIYSSILYPDARPEDVLFVKGKIVDNNGVGMTNVKVELKSVETNKKTSGLVDNETGDYAVAVPLKKKDEEFILTTKKDGYFYNTQHIKADDKNFRPPTTVDVKIQKIEAEKPIKLNNINFDFDMDNLTFVSKKILDDLVEFLNANSALEIEVDGHTDAVGDNQYNIDLSLRRARAVCNYLISKGIKEKRLSYKGFGYTVPLKSNYTDDGRAENRRVEFVVKKK